MTTARERPPAALLSNGQVLIAGGLGTGASFLASAELYDPAIGTFTATGNMTTAHDFQTATLLNNGDVLMAGGSSYGWTVLASAEIYTPSVPNQPPVANAGPDQAVAAGPSCRAQVTLDGSGSTDPDGDSLTYTWTEGATTLATTTDPVKTATVTLGLGMHTIALTVDDGNGGTDSDMVVVTVQDTTAPSIGSVAASPNVLWPPDHRLVPVSVAVSASDTCDAAPSCKILSVSSNEPVNGLGDGDTAPDWVITGNLTVNLRAERSGKGSGRIYTLTVQCSDASSNKATKTVTVTVPHDQRK